MNLKPSISTVVTPASGLAGSRNFPASHLAVVGKPTTVSGLVNLQSKTHVQLLSPLPGGEGQGEGKGAAQLPARVLAFTRPARHSAFSLIELLIVMTLLTLIVVALMEVFNSTQRAFRASVTQSDVLEGSRAAMDLITSDLRRMTPSGDVTNGSVNMFSLDNNYSSAMQYVPMLQTLPGASTGTVRSNVLSYFFILGRQNTKWIGVGYAVNVTNTASLNTLYRFYAETNISVSPLTLYTLFTSTVNSGYWTNMSPIMDGVFHLVVRPFDANGTELPNGYNFQMKLPPNVTFYSSATGNGGFYCYSNTIPASVEIQMGVLEDRALARALSLPNTAPAPPNDLRTQYLLSQSGSLHVFRQQVAIPNVDRSVYP